MHRIALSLAILAAGIFVSGCASTRQNLESKTAEVLPPHPIVDGCRIQDANGVLLWSYPEQFCLFLPDGRFVAADFGGVSLLAADGRKLWHRKMQVHHMINLAANGDVLLLTQEYFKVNEWPHVFSEYREMRTLERTFNSHRKLPGRLSHAEFRVDKITRLNLQGETVAEARFLGGSEYPLPVFSEVINGKLRNLEVSHFNSVYEIGVNASRIPAFKPGNILINDTSNRMIFVMDEKLTKIVWQLPYGIIGAGNAHDVQLLANGNLLFFKNFTITPSENSSLEEIDPETIMPVWRHFTKNPDDFRAPLRGSVQRLEDGRTVFAYENVIPGKVNVSRVQMIDRKGKNLWSLELGQHSSIGVQGAYSWPVEEFLKHVKH